MYLSVIFASYFVVGFGLGLGLDLVFGWLVVMPRMYLCYFML